MQFILHDLLRFPDVLRDTDDIHCFIPEAQNLTLVVHEQNDSFVTSASLYWNVTEKSDGNRTCKGAKKFQVRSVAYDIVSSTSRDHASNAEVMRYGKAIEWRNTSQRREKSFTFTSLSRSRWYVFQVQNNASADDDSENYAERIRQYSSHVYYFSQQGTLVHGSNVLRNYFQASVSALLRQNLSRLCNTATSILGGAVLLMRRLTSIKQSDPFRR